MEDGNEEDEKEDDDNEEEEEKAFYRMDAGAPPISVCTVFHLTAP